MEYRLIRARRKTLTLTVRPDGTVEVRAPLKLSRTIIDGFLEEKAAWIEKQQALRRLPAASTAIPTLSADFSAAAPP